MNKKILILLAAIFAVCMSASARNIEIDEDGDYGNTFQIDCAEAASEATTTTIIYDDGGTGNYAVNRSYIKEIASTNGGAISMRFTTFNLASGTIMTIKDAISGQILAQNASGNDLNGRTFSSNRGALQLIWTSGSTPGVGFAAKIWCGDMCQAFQTVITPSVPPTTEGSDTYYDICNGTEVSFSTATTFNQNHQVYDQSEDGLTYVWGIINEDSDTSYITFPQPGQGRTLTYTFTQSGGFLVFCNATDDRGCINRNINTVKVRVSILPSWENVSFGPDSICPGETVSLHGEPHVEAWEMEIPTIIADPMNIPDGNGTCYNSYLTFNIFDDGATITSVADIESVYLNLEHSFLGDLTIMIQCPSGQNCLLHACSRGTPPGWTNTGGTNNAGSIDGGSINLGLAPDPYSSTSNCYYTPGEGYAYYFTPNATAPFGTNGPTTSTSYTDPCGQSYTNSVLNAGDYASYENMSSLVGCPLNGIWTIQVCDFWGSDNGYMFEWGLFFREQLYPDNLWTFTNTYSQSTYSWSGVGMQTGQNGSINATAVVQNPDQENWSVIPYTFSATDNFGCTYDTTVGVHVRPAHDPRCCIEPTPVVTSTNSSPCGDNTHLSAGSFAYTGNTGHWTYTGPGTATFTNIDEPNTDVTVNVFGDYTFTWNEYYLGNETCNGSASINVNFARPMNATLQPITSRCRLGEIVVLSANDFGTLSCNPPSSAFSAEARTFTPSSATPGQYTITNTINNERCASPATSSQTFTVYDEVTVSNRDESCTSGANPTVTVSFSVNGVAGTTPPSYSISGSYTVDPDEQNHPAPVNVSTSGSTQQTSFSFTAPSPVEYTLVVSDDNGCNSVNVSGYRDCGCDNYAGIFTDYAPQILCTGDVYNFTHRDHTLATGAVLSYIVYTNPENIRGTIVATLSGTVSTVRLTDITGGATGVQYYLAAVAGFGEGEAAWSNRCRSISQAVPLMWKDRPQPTAQGGVTCGPVIQLNGSPVPSGMYGYWSASAPFTTIENTDYTMSNAIVLSGVEGQEVTYTWHIVNAECVGEASAIYEFRRIPAPQAGPDITVCGVQVEIIGARQTDPVIEGSILQWTGSGVVMTPASHLQTTANANGGGTYVVTLTERNGECVGSSSTTITFINVPSPATTANVDTVCGHRAELQVYNTNPANEGRWTAYDMQGHVLPTVTYNNYDNPNTAPSDRFPHCFVTVPIPDDETQVEYEFRWSEPINDPRLPADANCVGEAVKRIVFRKVPVISVHQCGSTGNSVAVCGNTVELCAETSASEGYSNFTWVCKDIAGNFTDSLSPTTTFTLNENIHISQYRDIDFYFIGYNESCMSIDTMHVRFLQRPEANAGVDHVACGDSYDLNGSWSLSPSDTYTPTCQWTVGDKPIPSAQVFWTNTPHDSIVEHVQVSDYGIYTFIVREINTMGDASSCFDRDTVTVEFMEIPNVRAGDDFNVCGLDFQLNAISSHVDGDNISGTWMSLTGGTDAFTDCTDPHTTGHYSAYGEATFLWTETNHPHIQTENEETCSASDEVVVTFYEVPSAVISMNEGDTVTCSLTASFLLRAEDPGDGISGYWYEVSPMTMFGPNNQTYNQPVTTVKVPTYGPHDFYWIEYTGPDGDPRFCKDTAGPWTITFLEEPVADITRDSITFCGYDGQLTVNFNGVGEGRWSSNTSASILTFDDRSDPNTFIHTIVQNDTTANPYYEVYWSVQNTEYCTSKDTAKVVFAPVPSDSIRIIPPKCFGGSAIITAHDETLPTYEWDFGNGYIDTIYTNNASGEYRAFIHWEDREETHIVGLNTKNWWGCTSNTGRAIVEEPQLPKYNYTVIGDTCALGRGGVEFLDTVGYFTFFWIDTTVGPEITDPNMGYSITGHGNHVYNLPTGTYTYRSDYQSFNTDYFQYYYQYFGDVYCHDFPEIEIGTIGMIEAAFAVSADVIGNLVAPNAEATFINSTNYDNVAKRCEWHFGDGEVERNCDELVPHTYVEPGCYEPYLIVMNRDIPECRDTAYLDECVFVDKESKLEYPNIFSPNGDGVNDFFQVKAQTLKSFHGRILNRYGRLVFEWTDWENEDAGWDGRLNGSTKATPGVYYYIIEAEGMDGVEYKKEGTLHLVR